MSNNNNLIKIGWNLMYALFYPIIMLFTLLFMVVSWILSQVSAVLRFLFSLIKK
jgi:hypothetical protein